MMTLFCLVFNNQVPFPINISPEVTVGELKDAIVAKKPITFQGIEADKLMLWKTVIMSEQIKDLKVQDFKDDGSLNAMSTLSEYFTEDPPKKRIHIVIKAPGK